MYRSVLLNGSVVRSDIRTFYISEHYIPKHYGNRCSCLKEKIGQYIYIDDTIRYLCNTFTYVGDDTMIEETMEEITASVKF